MELELEALHREAVAAEVNWDEQGFGPERIANARQFTTLVRKLTNDDLRDYQPGPQESAFSPSQLANYLADTCLRASSFLFAAGADADTWRRWCSLAGRLKALSGDLSYALQLCTIARCRLSSNILAKVRTAEIESYREQAVRHIILSHDSLPFPLPSDDLQPPDDSYAMLLDRIQRKDQIGIATATSQIVEFWLEEIDDQIFEPGAFPVFEPEINAVVAALVDTGHVLEFPDERIRTFLRAGLD